MTEPSIDHSASNDTVEGPDSHADTGTPRWVKVTGLVALALTLLVVVVLLVGGGGGHSPRRHSGGGEDAPPSDSTEHTMPEGGHES